MTNLNDNKISLKNLYRNRCNFRNIVSVLPHDKQVIYRRSLNNLLLKKIEENLNTQYENILISDYEILVFIKFLI
jgi:hypothetical protein